MAADDGVELELVFRITSLDYTPQFSDRSSSEYTNLCDDLQIPVRKNWKFYVEIRREYGYYYYYKIVYVVLAYSVVYSSYCCYRICLTCSYPLH